MKGKLIKTNDGTTYEILDVLTRQGNTVYLVCTGEGNVLIIDPLEIDQVLVETKDFKTDLTRYLNIAEEVIYQVRKAFLYSEDVVDNTDLGLYHDIEVLNELKYKIMDLPLMEMATYSDKITRHGIAAITVYDIHESEKHFKEFNATSVGNMAFVALNHPIHDVKVEAMIMLEQYRNYLKEKGLI
jgi:hypothetical protein